MADGLNAAQRQAVSTLAGPLLVLAGAGTGKTRVITYRIAHLIRRGTRPDRILALTFTNKAAREMRDRSAALLPAKIDASPLLTTFHALCARILRRHAVRLGYPVDFVIHDRSDQEGVARQVLREMRIGPERLSQARLVDLVSRWKSAAVEPESAARSADDEDLALAARAYGRYQVAMRAAGAVDFDDLLYLTELLFREPAVLAGEQARQEHILVDEYQDTSPNQYRILRKLAAPHRNLCVVGDDDQSIYGFRGADVRNILDFERDFPGAVVVRLEENYRSCPSILALANELIRRNPARHAKVLRARRDRLDVPRFTEYADEVDEAAGVVRDIVQTAAKERRGWSPFAVLFRTNEQPRLFEKEFRAKGVPYRLVGSFSFFDRREIRDLIAYLKLIVRPADEVSFFRIVNTPPRGLGETVLERLRTRAVESGTSAWEALPAVVRENVLRPSAIAALERFAETIEQFRSRFARPPLAPTLKALLAEVDYASELRRLHEARADQEARWEAVQDFVHMLAQYEARQSEPTLAGFLESVALADQDRRDEDADKKDAVALITLHSAKGLEFPHVYLVGMEEGLLPHERSLRDPAGIEEERRLCYVGVTRARDRLTLTRAKMRRRFGESRATKRSRFLYEMKGQDPPLEEPTPSVSSPRGRGGLKPGSERFRSARPRSKRSTR